MSAQVAILMGSDSDLSVMQQAADCLQKFGVTYHTEVVSAHRTPEKMYEFASQAHSKGIKIIIAGAGGAAHLPGMLASLTPLPVIGVPVNVTALNGMDSLLSILQMPKGVPVATVAIDNAFNAGLLAVKMLAIHDDNLIKQLNNYKDELKEKVSKMNQNLK